jgi:acyl-CoA thioesterase-1
MGIGIGTRNARREALGIATALLAGCGVGCSKGRDAAPASDSAAVAAKSNSEAAAAAPRPASRKTVIFVGTSLTAGLGLEPDSAYPMLIQQKIDAAKLPIDVVNAGVSGETSSGLLDRLDWLLRGTFDVMVIETGANDGLRGIPPATLRTNLQAVLDRIKARRPDARVVLIQMEALPNFGPQYAADFHRVFPEVAKEKGVPLLPFLLTDVAGHRDKNQGDGIHPNNQGERTVADNVWRGLAPILDSVAKGRASP